MPLDKSPKPAKPWVPDLLFAPVARPPAPVAPAGSPAPETVSAPERVSAGATVPAAAETAARVVERPASPSPATVALASDDPAELARILAEQEKALRDSRILRRNLQEEVAKARRTFMFAERGRIGGAKLALDDLLAREQQVEGDERRLSADIVTIRGKLERLRR